eukprot:TRINITY_DN3512_c1_g4_i1.p1 TRINITY_DN3512_c1_g4~~TRINITY_DN3512_c1_g4_i1.p1  ORF type:complete len:165 (+),score=24.07 TRINITY_DN3512_c1_g4_i1:14-508(+)
MCHPETDTSLIKVTIRVNIILSLIAIFVSVYAIGMLQLRIREDSWIETNCTFVSQRNTSYQDEYSVIQFDVLGKYPYNDSYKNFTRSFISSKHYTVTYDAGEVLGCYYDAEQQYFYFDKGVELAFYWMIIVGSGATAILSALLAIGMYIGCVRCVSEQMVYFND